MQRILVTVATCAALSGCGPDASRSTVVAADSAGVRVVTNGPGSLAAAADWVLEALPTVAIGSGVDPEVSLFRVVAIAPLDEGRVAIGMTAPPQVLVVARDGSLEATVGQGGDGPGEYMGVASVVRLGPDSLAVWDAERRRISVFTEEGRFHREVDLRGVAPLSWIASPNVVERSARTTLFALEPGSLVLFGVGVFGPGEGVRRVRVPSVAISSTGVVLDTIGAFPGEATFMSEQTGIAPYLLGPDTYGAVSNGGLIVASAESSEYRHYESDGDLRAVVRWPEPERTPGADRLGPWTEFFEGHLSALPPAESSSIREILEAMPEPELLPALTGLVASQAGEVWVGEYTPGQLTMGVAYLGRPPQPRRRWLVFDNEGALTAQLMMPEGFRPMAVDQDMVWGVHTDELGVESVRAYQVVR